MKAHPTDRVSLGFALIFLAVAGWWLVAQVANLQLPALGWFVAGGLILLGVLGLLGALRSGRGSATAGHVPHGALDPRGAPSPAAAEPRFDVTNEPVTGPPAWPAGTEPPRADLDRD